MSKIQPLIRVCGIALLLVTPLYIVDLATHGSDYEVGRMMTSQWKLAHQAEGAFYLLLTLAVVGLYLCQAEKVGTLGLVGFVLALMGCAFVVNLGGLYHAYLLPYMQSQYPTVLSPAQWYAPNGPLGAEISYVSESFIAAIVGLFLMGFTTARAGVLPRWAGILLAFGQATSLINFFAPLSLLKVLFPLAAIGFIAIAISYGSLGYVLATGRGMKSA